MKKTFLICLLLLLINSASCSISVNNKNPIKGEAIIISLSDFSINATINLQIKKEGLLLHEHDITMDSAGKSQYNYATSLLNPSGNYTIIALNETLNFSVIPTPASSTLLINFASPISQGAYQRAQTIVFKVKVLQNLNEVNDAQVLAYFNNEILNLTFSQGYYENYYRIPHNSEIKDYELIIAAQKGIYGGENIIKINVSAVPIIIELITPSFAELKSGETMPIHFKAYYPEGEALQNPITEFLISGKPVNITSNNSLDFYGNYKTSNSDGNLLDISLTITDDADNYGSKNFTIKLTDQFLSLINEYKYYIILLSLVIISSSYLIFSHYKKKFTSSSLETRKKELKELAKKAQEDYYIKGTIDQDAYESLMSDYEDKLSDIEENLKKAKKIKKKK